MTAAVLDLQSDRARVLRVSADEYYADPCEVPSLSQSIAKTLITRSPLHAWTEHPKLGGLRRASTKAKDDGKIIHSIMLGTPGELDVLSFDNYRTKAAQELRDAACEAGRTPVLERQYEQFLTIAGTLRRNIESCGIELSGKSEVAIEWRETGFHGDIVCRGKLDHLLFDRGTIYDLKKITAADGRTCSRHAYEYGYDIQHAAYTSAVAKLMPQFEGRVDFVFIFFELEPPYAVHPCRLDGTLRELGERRWGRALATWERCLREDRWPAYTDSITTLEAPAWAISNEEMISGNANL